MKKKQISLKNTVIKVFVEGYSYRPAHNKNLYIFPVRSNDISLKEEVLLEKIRSISAGIPHYKSIYMMRLVYKHIHQKTKRCVKAKRTKFYFTEGEITLKEKAVEYFMGFNEGVAKKVAALPGEKVVRIHYETFAMTPEHNYELLKEVG